jgi:ribonuclease-3
MNNYPLPVENLEKTIGYVFKNKNLIQLAMTHSSYANEHKTVKKQCDCNERLEFLGDSVLSLIVSEYIFDHFGQKPEGDLTKIRASVVCSKSLSSLARNINLGSYLLLGKGEESTGRNKATILENAFEALIAAIYLDSNNSKADVAKIILPFIIPEINAISIAEAPMDHKTTLQQFVQASSKEKIQYVLVDEFGPDHNKTFKVEVRLNSNVIGVGEGKSKKEAEQAAAKEALVLFDVK